jgi:preprotein translocase subunit SecA
MLRKLIQLIFGSRNQRNIRRMQKIVDKITALEPEIQKLTDDELAQQTVKFRQLLQDGSTHEQILPEAFATVRECGIRSLGMRHFDVQMIGAMVLNDGKIPEMRTGEGKTLVATLAVYLNAIEGKGVHLVTVNDYLARRDAEWMGRLYTALGMSVGVIYSGQDHDEKKAAYQADITYGTNNEFGFDYLRDNMSFSLEHKVQRGLNFAVVDEVDSILIDEARTPLIISGPADDDTSLYAKIHLLIPQLVLAVGEKVDGAEPEGDFTIDEKGKQVHMTEAGQLKSEEILEQAGLIAEDASLYDPGNIALLHHLNAALRANHLYQRNVEYIVRDNKVVIVDEFTGRVMPGRRWSEGLHQALEAKEGVEVERENQTLASITFQNYFRLYNKLSGMTGTADTEAVEFHEIYGLEVVVIPTNRGTARTDMPDRVYLSAEEKFEAIAEDIQEFHQKKQPILVGTASIEVSELISGYLTKAGITHEVLNAKQHEREADIIANAGMPGAVTIATNMAGRGTDIVLGGSLDSVLETIPEDDIAARELARAEWEVRHQLVKDVGGLFVVGTERHESRRIDNQLRGRSGRQGDPGASLFYLSLDDTLMRIFASPRMAGMMKKLGLERGEAIEHRWVSKAIENAQRKVESHNYDTRKNLLEFDDVSNDQRKVIYQQRDELLEAEEIVEIIDAVREDVVTALVASFVPAGTSEESWDVPGLEAELIKDFEVEIDLQRFIANSKSLDTESIVKHIVDLMSATYANKVTVVGEDNMRRFEKSVMLQLLDRIWKEHLASMDYLRQGIHLRGYAQKNPKQEYKREAFIMFNQLLDEVKFETITALAKVQVRGREEVDEIEEQRRAEALALEQQAQANHPDAGSESPVQANNGGNGVRDDAAVADRQALMKRAAMAQRQAVIRGQQQQMAKQHKDVGRNDPCPCESGKKYKHCHGRPGGPAA